MMIPAFSEVLDQVLNEIGGKRSPHPRARSPSGWANHTLHDASRMPQYLLPGSSEAAMAEHPKQHEVKGSKQLGLAYKQTNEGSQVARGNLAQNTRSHASHCQQTHPKMFGPPTSKILDSVALESKWLHKVLTARPH